MGLISERLWIPFLVVGMLVTGSVNTLSKKVAYQTVSENHKWTKPWTCTLVMFLGECLCLILFASRQKNWDWFTLAKPTPRSEKLLGGDDQLHGHPSDYVALPEGKTDSSTKRPTPALTLRSGLVCILPACCDVGGTTLSGIGLLFTTASVWQMLRGSIILFTGMLSVVFLKRTLKRYEIVGMAITIMGITVVGVASVKAPMTPLKANCCCTELLNSAGVMGDADGGTYDLCAVKQPHFIVAPADPAYALCSGGEGSKDAHLTFVGDMLIIVSQMMSGFQMVVEEKFLKGEGNQKLPSEFVVGCEGVFGVLILVIIFIPTLQSVPKSWDGIYEDIPDGFAQLGHSGTLAGVVFLYFCSISFYNFFGLSVAGKLSAVHRTLVDACRTIVVWSVNLSIYYASSGGGDECVASSGENWHGTWSTVQLAGFAVMLTGTFTYYRVIELPCIEYPRTASLAIIDSDDSD